MHTQWSPNTGMRQISPLPMRFPLYLRRAATRGGNYRLSSSTEFYGHFSHSAPQAKWQGSPTLRQTSFNRPDTLNTVIWLSTKCLPIQGRSNRKLMAFPTNSHFYHSYWTDVSRGNSRVRGLKAVGGFDHQILKIPQRPVSTVESEICLSWVQYTR